MKKTYGRPEAKKVNFQYSEVLAQSTGQQCINVWSYWTTSQKITCPKCTDTEHSYGLVP